MIMEIRCCKFCGRDTKNKCCICSHCTHGVNDHVYEEPKFTDIDDIEGIRQAFGFTDFDFKDLIMKNVEMAIKERTE